MKKTILLLALFAGINSINAQENIVKASLTLGNAGIQYERSLSQHFSVLGQVGFGFMTVSENENTDIATGMAYMLEARYYFSSDKDKMEGWHIGPAVHMINTTAPKANYQGIKDKYESTVYSIASGRQWVYDSNLTFEFMLGIGYQDRVYKNNSHQTNDTPIAILAGVSLGYSF